MIQGTITLDSQPRALFTASRNVVLQVWVSSRVSPEYESSQAYVTTDKNAVHQAKAPAMPDDGGIVEIRLAAGQTLYGIADDTARINWWVKRFE